jgi:arylsulfatase A-like enzyme
VNLHSRDAAKTCQGAPVLLALVLALATAGCGGPDRPNVLFIVLDTARADRVLTGDERGERTPRLAALARDATVYDDAWSPAPWTVPAHASLFTGRYPSAHGTDCGALTLPDDETTLAEILRDAGYRTVGYTANPWLGKGSNFRQGFDTWVETWRDVRDDDPDTGATLNNERIIRFLRWRQDDAQARRQPFLLFANYFEPHLPYRPPEPERARRLRPGSDPARVARMARLGHPDEMRFILGRSDLTADDLAVLSDLYDGEIAYVDRRVGEVIETMRELDLLDHTIVAVVGDHGENLGEHGMLDHKMSVDATLLHVPLLLRYPPRVAAGAHVAARVQSHDLFPTILRLAGIDALPPGVEAVPLPGAGIPGAGRAPGAPIVGEFAGPPVEFLDSMREAFPGADLTRFDRTLVAWHRDGFTLHWGSDGRHTLYRDADDPGETRDLAAAEPERVKAMAADVEGWLKRPARRHGPRPPG